jgi:hypothetical protein
MILILERKVHNKTSTEGNLYIDNGPDKTFKWFCHTIEDVVRAKPGEWKKELKVYAKTAIPYGTYPVMVTWSNKFKRPLTLIANVPDFEGIRIHNGSSENSSAGCLIVSYKDDDGADHMRNRVINDPKAMNDLCKLVEVAQKKEKIIIDIVDKKEDSKHWKS